MPFVRGSTIVPDRNLRTITAWHDSSRHGITDGRTEIPISRMLMAPVPGWREKDPMMAAHLPATAVANTTSSSGSRHTGDDVMADAVLRQLATDAARDEGRDEDVRG